MNRSWWWGKKLKLVRLWTRRFIWNIRTFTPHFCAIPMGIPQNLRWQYERQWCLSSLHWAGEQQVVWGWEHDIGKHVSESGLKGYDMFLLESVLASCHPRVWRIANTQQVFDESDWILSAQYLNTLLGTPYPAQHQHLTQCFVNYKHSTNIWGRDGWSREEVPFSLWDRVLYICETYQNEENEVRSLLLRKETM